MKRQVAIGYDHRGAKVKNTVINAIKEAGWGVALECESQFYSRAAITVGSDVMRDHPDSGDVGILICGTGIGMSIAANKVKGIRAAHVATRYQAQMCREHNDANVLCLGAIQHDRCHKIEDLVTLFLEIEFTGEQRHCDRLDVISKFEGDQCLEKSTS